MSILNSGKNFLLDKSGLQQHFDENEILRAAADNNLISNELYNKMGGFNFKENVPFAGDFGTGLGSFTYNVAQSVLGNQPISEIPGDVARNYMGAAVGLTKDEKDLYDSILGRREPTLTDSLVNIPSNIKNTLGDLIFTPASADADKPLNITNTGARDFSEFDKARMGAQLAARGVSPDVISQIDKQTADEEGALLDDAFEKQLALATRTGRLGPFEGIMKAISPKNIAGFITDSLPITLAAQGLSSIADRLGIRRGMAEPPGAAGTGGYGISRTGNTISDQTRKNRDKFADFYSNFQGGAQHHMGKRVDNVINRTVSGRRTRSDASDFVNKYGSEEQKSRFAGIQKDKENVQQNPYDTTEGQGGGGGKVVCTMMNKSYGFGSFRNKIWMKFHKDLSPEYQKGYHRIFLPLVKIAKKNKIVRKILEHIAVHSTIDMRQSMRGKKHLLGRLYRKIILPICYWVGKK